MGKPKMVALQGYEAVAPHEMEQRAREFYERMRRRRTVRQFSSEPVPPAVIEFCLQTAGTAPSGANLQPWHFVVVSDPSIKREIRTAAEREEREFYERRASPEWLAALEKLGTDWRKPFLETAPYLIAIFYQAYGFNAAGEKVRHYYALESVGIATGMLITALHLAGLATLTHTPSPMKFLSQILDRPVHERPFLLLVVGRPASGAEVPDISRKALEEIRSIR